MAKWIPTVEDVIPRSLVGPAPRQPRAVRLLPEPCDDQVAHLFGVVSDDETALLTFLLETACRREGLLDLEYLRQEGCPVYRWTRRRLDSLWLRIRHDLAWADEIGLSTHWFRHTTITDVERATRSPVLAAAFAGHRLSRFGTYFASYGPPDIAWTFTQAFGGQHPLVPPGYVPSSRKGPS